MKRLWLVTVGLGLLATGLVRGADPLDDYENQVIAPAQELRKSEKSTAELRLAAEKLVRLSRALPGIIHELSRSLADPDEVIRLKAAEALGAIGPSAYPAIPSLLYRLGLDPSAEVRAGAASALASIWSTAHVECEPQEKAIRDALTYALKDNSRTVRHRAAGCLWCFGKAAVPALVRPQVLILG